MRQLLGLTSSCTPSKQPRKHLPPVKSITLPRPDERLWIVTDGSVKKAGIGATLYVNRQSKLHLAGFYSAQLKQHQTIWLPCEVEASSIAAALKHFSPYFIQSKHQACVLTDSRPCVQSYEKLCRGEFSSSARVTTFLSTVSRYQAAIQHLAGKANIPTDFASRNAPDCSEPHCQVCSFVDSCSSVTVNAITVEDVVSGTIRLPFTNHFAWIQSQTECPDLRRTKAHLKQGTRPSKKVTNAKDVKSYLQSVSLSPNGFLIIRRDLPFSPARECIVVPRSAVDGLLTALHLRFNHPTSHQLRSMFTRYFFVLELDTAITRLTSSCHTCTSLAKIPSSHLPVN